MASETWPAISVIMPVLNEEQHLEASLRGVLDQDYPGEMEIVLAVGPSRDRTQQIADDIAARDLRVTVVPNPAGTTPEGLNHAIAASRHDYVIRVDGHGELCPGYFTTAVEVLRRTGAANVGGLMDARGRTPFERAVAAAYNSRLGLGGGAFHLADSPEGPAESVFLGAFRRDALLAMRGFDPTMLRAQDWELNRRLRQAGEVVWFTPRLRVTYRPRSTVKALAKQFHATGRWRREVVRRHPETASPRYLAPGAVVAASALGTAAAVIGLAAGRPHWALGLLAPVGYLAGVTAGAAVIGRGEDAATRRRLPGVLAVMHFAWGAGFLRGLPAEQRQRGADAPRPGPLA